MKIIFFGNTSFGVPTLEKLNESKIEIAAVVTNSDLSKKRKKKSKTSIKSWAEQNSINLIQQDKSAISRWVLASLLHPQR